MEGANQHPPTQVVKPSKNESKQTTLSVSQKAGVVKTTKTKKVGKVKLVSEGDGTGVSQPLQKYKESEGVLVQPIHFVPSQKGKDVNKEISYSLLAPSQKGVSIEKGPHPGTRNKGNDTNQTPPQPKMFERRKKPKIAGVQGTHTVVQSVSTSVTKPHPTSVVDASPTNVEK